MVIEQKRYSGASLTNINCNLGWNSSPSTVSLSLVEDKKAGDVFIRPDIGGPTFVQYYGISMGGIVTGWQQNSNTGGDPLFSVTIEDPRSILEGVQLITEGYTGGIFSTPNLYNIFGYWESFSFGNSQVNNTGMPWKRIRDGLINLVNTTPVKFGTTSYYLNLSALPSIPEYFRIAGPNLSVMDFITQVCEAASHEFFFNLEEVTSKYYIRLYVVDRSKQPALNRISTFLDTQSEVVSTSNGQQLRNETSSKFLVGGNVHSMYYQWPSALLPTTRSDDIIWPFWGVDEDNNVIIGSEPPDGGPPASGDVANWLPNNHTFTLPSRSVNVVGIGPKYKTNIQEMRAAIGGIDAWKLLLKTEDKRKNSPHYLKATKIGLDSDVSMAILDGGKSLDGLKAITPVEFAALTGGTISKTTNSVSEIHEENISRLYEYVKGYASEYYGRKFMVRLPNISAKLNTDTGIPEFNLEPTDGGFLEDSLWSGAILRNYLPQTLNTLLLDDNRIAPYVRFNDFTKYDFSEISPQDFTISKNSAFVKCSLDDDIYFLSYSGLYSPRAVINLPGPINKYEKENNRSFNETMASLSRDSDSISGLTAAEKSVALKSLASKVGSDVIQLGSAGLAEMPDMVACPLKSNVDFYGPWYAIGANGKTDFQKDESLVPWNYGGFSTMNLAANAQISSALSNMQIGEEGTLELAGVPAFSMGDQLISGGPYITDINVSIDSRSGATTTYTLRTWGARNTGVQKQLIDKVQQMRIQDQKNKRESRERDNRTSGANATKREHAYWLKGHGKLEVPRPKSSHSSSPIITSESIHVSGDIYKANTVITPSYYIAQYLGSGYEQKSVGSLDTLFRPFSTDPDATGIPHFNSYDGTDTINASSLNPYQSGNDFLLVSKNFPTKDQHMHDADGFARGVGFRMPMIGVGWGYDKQGNPVPNSGDIEEDGDKTVFVEDHMKRMDLWKTGPIDMRWDGVKKVWSASGGGILHGKLMDNISPGGSGVFRHYAITSSGEHWTGTEDYVNDWLLKTSQSIIAGASGLNCIVGIDSNTSDKYILEVWCV